MLSFPLFESLLPIITGIATINVSTTNVSIEAMPNMFVITVMLVALNTDVGTFRFAVSISTILSRSTSAARDLTPGGDDLCSIQGSLEWHRLEGSR